MAVFVVIKQYHDEADVIQCHHHFFKSTSISLGGSKNLDSTGTFSVYGNKFGVRKKKSDTASFMTHFHCVC